MEDRAFLVEDLERVLEELAPRAYAEPWDNVGRLVGRRSASIDRVLVALDCTEDVVVEATTAGFQAIVTHHPLIFAPVSRVTDQDRVGLLVTQLISADIALIAAHTNLDAAPGGLNDLAAEELGLLHTVPLVHANRGWKKLVGFVPAESLEQVSKAVFAAGAGTIGAYQSCAFESRGEGTFVPGAGARPHVGSVGQPERMEEVRWETVVPSARVAAAIRAFIHAHPYEEPAFDIYPIDDVATAAGMGRVGSPRVRLPLVAQAEAVAEAFGLREVTFSGDSGRLIDRVAVVTGSGASLIEEAAAAADVLVTGDLKYHDAERAADLGLALIVVPHDHLETFATRLWNRKLSAALRRWDVEAVFSATAKSPWRHAVAVGKADGDRAFVDDDHIVRLFDIDDAAGGVAAEGESTEGTGRMELDDEPSQYVLRVDGGSRGNPGPSAIGVVLEDDQGNVVEEIGARIGHATNNVAEYQALITGLETAGDRGVRRLRILSDSLLLVRQLRGEFKVKNAGLRELYFQARSLVQQFDRVEIRHVPREENTAADSLVNQALDGKL